MTDFRWAGAQQPLNAARQHTLSEPIQRAAVCTRLHEAETCQLHVLASKVKRHRQQRLFGYSCSSCDQAEIQHICYSVPLQLVAPVRDNQSCCCAASTVVIPATGTAFELFLQLPACTPRRLHAA